MVATRQRSAAWQAVVWYWLPVLVWMTLILLMSARSDLPVRTNPATGEEIRTTTSIAKLAHIVEYGVLAWLLFRALTAAAGRVCLSYPRAVVVVIAVATGFGAIDELFQSFVPTREPRVTDVLLDGASATVVALVLYVRARRRVAGG
jgi:VanZ family protein